MKNITPTAAVTPVQAPWGRLAVLVAVAMLPAWLQAQVIQSVRAASQGGTEVIQIETSAPLKQLPKGFAIQSPARIALDFAGVTNGLGQNLVDLNQGNLRSANVVEAGDRTRVVLNLNRAASYQTRIDGKTLLVTLEPMAAATPQGGQAAVVFAESGNQNVQPLKDVDFRRTPENAGRVVVNLANNQVGVDIKQSGKSLVVEFLKTALPEGLRRKLDVVDFGTPVQSITTAQVGDRVRMVIEPKGLWEHSAYQSDNQFVLEVREQKIDPNKLSQGPGYTGEKLSLNFQNIEVRALLQVIADFTNFNIITSDTVGGNVTLRLKDVPWDQALDIILQAKGLGMRKTGNVIWIAPKDEIAAREKLDYESAAQVQTLEPLRTQSFQLNYAKVSDIAAQLRGDGASPGGADGGASARILSPRGSVIPEARTNQLFVTDIPSRLEQIKDLVNKLDVPVRQVMIEARIVEADEKFGKSIGVRLGAGVRDVSTDDKLRFTLGGSYNQVSSGTARTDTPFVNLPAQGLQDATPITFAASLFSPSAARFLNLEISALQADNQGRVVSSPRLITADQVSAVIEQGVEIPYQQATSSGATSVAFRKASLKLEVTPQITPEGGIILNVEVNKDSPGEVLVGLVTINTNRVKTQVLVENGGTVVIGGIFRSSETSSENKVPVLGDVPVVGNLFKNRTRSTEKRELLVFLTPRVLGQGLGAR
jgi:type IV pilus assembly protein PilQ